MATLLAVGVLVDESPVEIGYGELIALIEKGRSPEASIDVQEGPRARRRRSAIRTSRTT